MFIASSCAPSSHIFSPVIASYFPFDPTTFLVHYLRYFVYPSMSESTSSFPARGFHIISL